MAHTGHTETFAFDPASNRVPLPQTNNPSQNTQGKQEQEQALADVHHKTKRPISLISQGKHITFILMMFTAISRLRQKRP